MKKTVNVVLSALFVAVALPTLLGSAASESAPVASEVGQSEPPQMMRDCRCSAAKERQCEAKKMYCCATQYPNGRCSIYCGSACLAPY